MKTKLGKKAPWILNIRPEYRMKQDRRPFFITVNLVLVCFVLFWVIHTLKLSLPKVIHHAQKNTLGLIIFMLAKVAVYDKDQIFCLNCSLYLNFSTTKAFSKHRRGLRRRPTFPPRNGWVCTFLRLRWCPCVCSRYRLRGRSVLYTTLSMCPWSCTYASGHVPGRHIWV